MFNQLTKKDIEAMEAEIEERKLVIRPKLLGQSRKPGRREI